MAWLMTMPLVLYSMAEQRVHSAQSDDGVLSQQPAIRVNLTRSSPSLTSTQQTNILSLQHFFAQTVIDTGRNDENVANFEPEVEYAALTYNKIYDINAWRVIVSHYDPVQVEQDFDREQAMHECLAVQQFALEWQPNNYNVEQARKEDSPCCCGWC